MDEIEIAALPFDPRRLPDPELELPDLDEAEVGWRAWTVNYDLPRFGLPPKLHSATFKTHYWTPGRASMAACSRGCPPDDMPGRSCKCGFYAAKSVKHLLRLGYASRCHNINGGKVGVIGEVALWGKIVEGNQGYRAQYAYPTKLYLPFEANHLAKPLSEAYGVEVVPMNFIRKGRS